MVPRAFAPNHFGLEEADDRFGKRIVIRVAAAADGRLDAGVGQPFRIPHRHVLRAAIAVMNQIAGMDVAAVIDGLVQGIEDKISHQGRGDAPADDASREDIDDERDIDKAPPGRNVREISVCLLKTAYALAPLSLRTKTGRLSSR